MKKRFYVNLLLMLLLMQSFLPSFAEPYSLTSNDIVAEAALLMDQESGQILFQKNMNKVMYPASITKIMTAILIIEDLDLDDTVVIDAESPFTEGNRIYVIENEIFTVGQLLYATMIESANDAAVALAKYHSGSVEAFAQKMNERAKELGAMNTNFVNPNGLPHDEHVTTAYDMALIGKYAMTLPKLREIVSTVKYQIPPTNKQSETRYMTNSNRFLYGTGSRNQINYNGNLINIKYDAVKGIKTGYTIAAGQTFVAYGEKDGKKLISVILKSEGKNLYVDTRRLLDYGFDNFERKELMIAGEKVEEINFEDEKNTKLPLVTRDALVAYLPLGVSVSDLSKEVQLEPDITLPVKAGQVLGFIQYSYGELIISSSELIAPGFVSDKALLDDDIKLFEEDTDNFLENTDWVSFSIRAGIVFIIWRMIMTFYNLQRRKYALRMKQEEEKSKSRSGRTAGGNTRVSARRTTQSEKGDSPNKR
ncbi:D-alanyl-D-alanine carboxypeptidase family protein [Fusibacter sp. JL216-2]|uniref:D-alanyl-D-alanine carboxypeptidase family protein n=1 Tax=Fusibacter sp. JL216-2 TaxID=3071453 RepID=UPI003D34A6DC